MNFLDCLKRLEDSEIFKIWKKENPKAYLAHGFIMDPEKKESDWQIGYFNPETEKILTFVLSEEILMNPESEVMSKEIKEIDRERIKISEEEAFNTTDRLQKEKYSAHPPLKKMVILQNSEKQVWNITYVTMTFKTLNIKIDAETGKVDSDQIVEVFRFDK